MKYDLPLGFGSKHKGFYVWNKPTCFIKKDDDRYSTFIQNKKETGISPDETWSLYHNIAVFLVPRLKLFKERQANIGGHPGCFDKQEDWLNVLDKIIWSFEQYLIQEMDIAPNSYFTKYPESDPDRFSKAYTDFITDIQEGLHLFAEYFGCLWW